MLCHADIFLKYKIRNMHGSHILGSRVIQSVSTTIGQTKELTTLDNFCCINLDLPV